MSGLRQHLVFWLGLVFTVGGAVASLWIGGEYVWMGALFLLTGWLALGTFAYEKQRQVNDLTRSIQIANRRVDEAEQRLNAIPADILSQLGLIVEAHAFAELARLLARHAAYVERMRTLAINTGKPPRLRFFAKRAGRLYVVAGVSADAQVCLEEDDPLILDYKDANGLVTRSASARVHQKEPSKEIVWLRVENMVGDEMAHLDALADRQEVPAKGYSVRPLCDLARYASVNLTNVADAVRLLIDEMAINRE